MRTRVPGSRRARPTALRGAADRRQLRRGAYRRLWRAWRRARRRGWAVRPPSTTVEHDGRRASWTRFRRPERARGRTLVAAVRHARARRRNTGRRPVHDGEGARAELRCPCDRGR
eukprot:358772-Chlamydomonas_euryale.AAC.27